MSALVRYGERLSSLEHINPPKNAEINFTTYPMGEINAVGSSVIRAAAVLAKSRARLTPAVMRILKKELLRAVSSLLSTCELLFL